MGWDEEYNGPDDPPLVSPEAAFLLWLIIGWFLFFLCFMISWWFLPLSWVAWYFAYVSGAQE